MTDRRNILNIFLSLIELEYGNARLIARADLDFLDWLAFLKDNLVSTVEDNASVLPGVQNGMYIMD